jgi:methylated-DNA-[protein]-cysteine S-methyltransferase
MSPFIGREWYHWIRTDERTGGENMISVRETSIGPIGIEGDERSITRLYLPNRAVELKDLDGDETPVVREAFRQLEMYLDGRLREFSLPLKPEGTEFFRRVWEKLREVPYGKTASYKDLAVASGNPKAVRAVGMANARNPIAIFIPCHRIIGTSGKLVGFGGGLELKSRLLALEARNAG